MAVTSPDNIRTPDSGDQYALVQDLGVLADTTQAAITKRGNLFVGTAAQRTAFTTAPAGTHWQDTDGSAFEYVRAGGAWLMLGSKFYSGTAAQRTAFTTAPNGAHWQDTDGSKLTYRRDSASWVAISIAWEHKTLGAGNTDFPAPPPGTEPIMKTGYVKVNLTAGIYGVTFANPFPNRLLHVSITTLEGSAVAPVINGRSYAPGGFNAIWQGAGNAVIAFTYLAIGY